AEHFLDLEAIVVKSRHIALRSFKHRDVSGEAARGQKRRLKPERRGMTAMRRFGHGAGIGQQASRPRCRDTEGVRELIRVQLEDMSGRDGGAERTCGTGRMKSRRARLELPRRLANPALHFNAFD